MEQVFLTFNDSYIGGTSILNLLIYVRGNPHDYDNWANITGDHSWKYDNILKYFKKSIDYHGSFTNDSKKFRLSLFES